MNRTGSGHSRIIRVPGEAVLRELGRPRARIHKAVPRSVSFLSEFPEEKSMKVRINLTEKVELYRSNCIVIYNTVVDHRQEKQCVVIIKP